MRALILAGGSGTRLWPISRPAFPKQFLQVIGNQSLLQLAVERARALTDHIDVITQPRLTSLVLEQTPGVEVILEPVARSTGPALVLAMRSMQLSRSTPLDLDEPVFIGTADHLIGPVDQFVKDVRQAAELALDGYLVTFGVRPTHPETGFGYIELDPVGRVLGFVEKPDLATATQYLLSGRHFWNSGMFCMTPRTFWQELRLHAPALAQFEQSTPKAIMEAFSALESISIDYALMERSCRIAMVPLNCSWSDVGSWDQLYQLLDKDGDSNAIIGSASPFNSRKNLVYGRKRPIALIDCEDLIIVDSEEALLIAKRGSSQKVRLAASEIAIDVR